MKSEILTSLALASLCGVATSQASAAEGNVLVIVADDLGKELLSIYNAPTKIKAKTPNIDRLAKRGTIYDNVWGMPLSAPVRAAMLTGKYGHRTGILSMDGLTLSRDERTLFDALPESYKGGLFGKWNLSEYDDFAADYGLDHFAGLAKGGGVRSYNMWQLTVNGKSAQTRDYMTTVITDSAKGWIEAQTTPWLCWVAYTAPHVPLHLPPSHMHSYKKLKDNREAIESDPMSYFLAMIESLDYEIGRLMEGIGDDTTIIFVGDNGTDNSLLQEPYPYRHGKNSLYEGGIAIPMIISAGRGERSDRLVSAVDIFPTVLELCGVNMARYEDGYSAIGSGVREYNFAEINHVRFGYTNAISDGRYKLISTKSGQESLYDVKNDPMELTNLIAKRLTPEAEKALEKMRAELKAMEIPYDELPSTGKLREQTSEHGAGGQRTQGANRQTGTYRDRENSNQNRGGQYR
ncbi:MAG: sulfatase-like hydrolase/transferase [Rikenellaceae bacterium]